MPVYLYSTSDDFFSNPVCFHKHVYFSVALREISVDLSVIICYTEVHRGNTENHRVVGNDLITPEECCGNSSDA